MHAEIGADHSSQSSMTSPGERLLSPDDSNNFFSFSLNVLTLTLGIVTLLVGVVAGVGVAIVVRLMTEKRQFEKQKKGLQNEFDRMLSILKETALGHIQLNETKRELQIKLAEKGLHEKDVYHLLQKTVTRPDQQCIEIYAEILDRFEENVNMIRVVRNGLSAFAKK